jgi:hypothetical protein
MLKIEYFLRSQKILYFPSQSFAPWEKYFLNIWTFVQIIKLVWKVPTYYTCIHLQQCLKGKQLLKPGVHGSSSVHRCERKESSTLISAASQWNQSQPKFHLQEHKLVFSAYTWKSLTYVANMGISLFFFWRIFTFFEPEKYGFHKYKGLLWKKKWP